MDQTRCRPAQGGADNQAGEATTSVPPTAGDLLAAALAYAALGWRVHPCRWDKTPLTASWIRDASTSPGVITTWWARWPRANVAVATGAPGPDVLDVDTKKNRPGLQLLDRVRRAGLLRGAAAIVRTPSGGLHVWFAGTGQHGGAVGEGKALELKATGGYVLLPPSYVQTPDYAGTYELVERRDTAATIDWPAVRRLLDPPRTRSTFPFSSTGGVRDLAEWLAGQSEGNRNQATYWAACRALEAGHEDLADLLDAAVSTGLAEWEARRTVESARRRIWGGVA